MRGEKYKNKNWSNIKDKKVDLQFIAVENCASHFSWFVFDTTNTSFNINILSYAHKIHVLKCENVCVCGFIINSNANDRQHFQIWYAKTLFIGAVCCPLWMLGQ